MTTSCSLTIFEGVDGAGKTMAAQAYAKLTGAKYVHFPALKEVGHMLPRLYVEAMLPALMGYQPVVFDRSWLSEPIYGNVFRNGVDRVGPAKRALLERLALRCGAVVVRCDPGWDAVRFSYEARKGQEMLENLAQVAQVHRWYQNIFELTDLPVLHHDYTSTTQLPINDVIEDAHQGWHPLRCQSAGNLYAPVAIVGDEFAERKDVDPWYQWPFGSFSSQGCSLWLTQQLTLNGISENDLLWLNKGDVDLLHEVRPRHIVALGKQAEAELYREKLTAIVVQHPQYHKRFNIREEYPLIALLQSLTENRLEGTS